ncbi:uncharacterized protein LOC125670090 isoform X2 [Ostrea edulis]|nr:uncharacterized protein LOC125670090 isoform X2 [Ostrea edulis]
MQEEGPSSTNSDPTSRKTKPGRNIKIGIIVLFLMSVGLHVQFLISYLKENNADPNPTLLKAPESLKGLRDESESNGGRCLLTIEYDKNIKAFDTFDNGSCTPSGYEGGAMPSCICAKRVSENETSKLKAYKCKDCIDDFPPCQNGGTRKKCERCHLKETECGKCECPTGNYTGRYCHLPEKLECVKCEKTCSSLSTCNSNYTHPCRYSFKSTVLKCSKPESGDIIDCASMFNSPEPPPLNRNEFKGSDRYTVMNSSQSAPLTCSREVNIVYLVLDWVVFIVMCLHIVYKTCNINKSCNKISDDKIKRIYWVYILSVVLLIVIPPIVHCVSCCSITCNSLEKALPFVKASLLAIVLFLLCFHVGEHSSSGDEQGTENGETLLQR